MGSILDVLGQSLDAKTIASIGKPVGGDKAATGAVISAAVPLLISALARNASEPEGAEALHEAVIRDHSGSILDNLSDHLSNPQAANGAGILGHVLGDQEVAVEQGLSQGTGLDAAAVGQILQIVAPLVMGALGQATQQQGLDTSGLAGMLGTQREEVQQSSPDLASLLGGLLGGNQGADQGGQGADLLGGILGSLLGGQR